MTTIFGLWNVQQIYTRRLVMSNLTFNNSTLYSVLSVVGLGWYVVLWSISLLGCRIGWVGRHSVYWQFDAECIYSRARYRLRPRSPLATSPNAPGVSILRPLKGLDTNLYENLESTFVQEYPNFEILLSVADEDDQALTVVRELMSQYPQVNAKIIIGAHVTPRCIFHKFIYSVYRRGDCWR